MRILKNLFLTVLLIFSVTKVSAQNVDDIPTFKFKTAQEAAQHNIEVLTCCDYLLSHKFDDPNYIKLAANITIWACVSADVNIEIMSEEWMLKNGDGKYLLMAYIAGWTRCALRNNVKTNTFDCYKSAVKDCIEYYKINTSFGKIKILDKYASMNETELTETLNKKYYSKK